VTGDLISGAELAAVHQLRDLQIHAAEQRGRFGVGHLLVHLRRLPAATANLRVRLAAS